MNQSSNMSTFLRRRVSFIRREITEWEAEKYVLYKLCIYVLVIRNIIMQYIISYTSTPIRQWKNCYCNRIGFEIENKKMSDICNI